MSFLTSCTATNSSSSLLRSTALPLLFRPATTTVPRRRLARMTIIGRLGAEPEVVATSTGKDVVRYALATRHGPRDHQYTTWWRVACFVPEGHPLRDLVTGLTKGTLVCVEGDCNMARWKDKEGGDREGLNIVQRHIEVLERREPPPESTETPEAAAAVGE